MAYRVLVADDSEAVRKVIRAYLQDRRDIEICGEAANGRDAIELALTQKPDVLILDVVMPELNGIEVATLARQALPEAKTILFTMYGAAIGPHLAKAAGVHVILAKPDGMTRLVWVLDSLMYGLKGTKLATGESAANKQARARDS
jgi:DNA-binding NarL/FixJ family response regulator